MQIQLTSEITYPYSTMSVISGLFYTSYSHYINITMKYTHDYATRMPTREKITNPWNNFHGIWADISRYAYREYIPWNMGRYSMLCVSGNTIVRI